MNEVQTKPIDTFLNRTIESYKKELVEKSRKTLLAQMEQKRRAVLRTI